MRRGKLGGGGASVRSATCAGRAASSPTLRSSRTSSRRSPRHASPSVARRAPTTASARRRWRIASVSVISNTELLRLVTAGSVDDGKSTLIGRVLFDSKQIMVDQMEHIEDASRRRGHDYVDLALLTDGL